MFYFEEVDIWETTGHCSPEIHRDTVHLRYPPVLVPPTSANQRRGGPVQQFHHVCAHTWLGPLDWAHTNVPTHVCAQTRLCPDAIVPREDCAQTWLCPDMIVPTQSSPYMTVPRHVCAQTHLICTQTWLWWMYPYTLVPKHELLWPDMFMSLVNNNVVIVSTRLICVKLINYVSIYTFLPRHVCDHTIITCQGTNVFGHKRVWAQACLGINVSGH